MERYKEYKDSGIDWIGEIPSHWKICKVKNYSDIYSGEPCPAEDQSEDFDNPIYGGGDILGHSIKPNMPADTLILGRVGGDGKVRHVKTAFWATDNALIIDTKLNKTFLGNVLNCADLLQYNTSTAQPLLTATKIKNINIPVPPASEQKEIADYLDKKCGEIDAAVAKVDKELELLDELKQSEISKAVTKGLNPNVSFKPSGIDWISQIPSHWKDSKIKYHISRSAAGVWGNEAKNDENDIICFRIADFEYDKRCLGFEKLTTRNILPKELEGRLASFGDLLIEKSGGGDVTPVGRVVMFNYPEKATYTNFIHGITLKDNIDNRYMLFYFNMLYSNKINLLFFNQTTGLQNLQVNDYLSQYIKLPPISEQKEIADYLDKKCGEIDSLKEKLKQKKEKFQELRKSLISEVVTGKRYVGTSRAMYVNKI